MAVIFISYRRKDSEGLARGLFDRMVKAFGRRAVFMDVENVAPGVDFRAEVEAQIPGCSVVLAVIGPYWLAAPPDRSRARLFDDDDLVRFEIRQALRLGKHVVPVLVQGATMPKAEQLPDDVRELAVRNEFVISSVSLDDDCRRLARSLARWVRAKVRWRFAVALAALVLASGAAAWALHVRPTEPRPVPVLPLPPPISVPDASPSTTPAVRSSDASASPSAPPRAPETRGSSAEGKRRSKSGVPSSEPARGAVDAVAPAVHRPVKARFFAPAILAGAYLDQLQVIDGLAASGLWQRAEEGLRGLHGEDDPRISLALAQVYLRRQMWRMASDEVRRAENHPAMTTELGAVAAAIRRELNESAPPR